jgi:hypothetical protein
MLQPATASPSAIGQPSAVSGPGPGPTEGSDASTTTGAAEPVLCRHCGRTASNGISCEGYCVADSGY